MMKRGFVAALLVAAGSAVAGPPDLLLEADLQPDRVTVQTQADYRLRLYQGVAVRDVTVVEPRAPLAEFRPSGETRVYEAVRDGRRYRVHERRYAVFPFASGALNIAGVHADVRLAERSVRVEAAPRVLTVLPMPSGAAVAAKSLSLSETWSPSTGAAVGDVLHRQIRIEAAGVDAGQLPEIRFEVSGVAVHAESVQLENRFRDGINIATRVQSFSLVPQRAGDIAMPGLRVNWWNTDAGTHAVAALPARTLQVLSVRGAVPAGAAPVSQPAPPYVAIVAFALLLGATAILVWRRRARLCAAWRLRRACRAGDAQTVRDALLAWVATVRPETTPRTLGALAESLDDAAACRVLRELDRSLYGPAAGRFDTATLASVVRAVRRPISDCRRAAAPPAGATRP